MTGKPAITSKAIGVWLELYPGQPLSSEGIGRLLGLVINGAARSGQKWLIACPSWYRQELDDFLAGLPPPARSATAIVSVRRTPAFFNRHRAPAGAAKKRRHAFLPLLRLKREIFSWLSRRSRFGAIAALVLASPLLLPAAAIWAFSRAIAGLLFYCGKSELFIISAMRRFARRALRYYWQTIARVMDHLHNEAVEFEYKELAKEASRRQDAAVWFVPNPSWHRARLISRPLVAAVPDFVVEDFPLVFKDLENPNAPKSAIRRTLLHASCTISFREYVRQKHVVDVFGYPPERAFVVPHAPVDLLEYSGNPEVSKIIQLGAAYGGTTPEASHKAAADLVRSFCRQRYLRQSNDYPFHAAYLPDFPFEDARFVLLSTQTRGYKNLERVIEAIELLLRRQYFDIKLICTGSFDAHLADLVSSRHLEYDVIALNRVPADVHACLYHLAALAVHPSFFEGGFPFVFSEALSVGTPALLARVPAVMEVLDERACGEFLFDPYSSHDLAAKIQHCCRCRDSILASQLEILEGMNKRTWEDVAAEYMRIFAMAAAGRQPEKTTPAPERQPAQESACR